MIGTTVTAVSIGKVNEDELLKLGNYGANKVINVNNEQLITLDSQAYTYVISELVKKEKEWAQCEADRQNQRIVRKVKHDSQNPLLINLRAKNN